MTTVDVEKSIKEVVKKETKGQYLQRIFILQNGEFRVDFHSVGGNNYRINFWAKKERPGALTSFKDNYISRSYYVVLIEKGISWKHNIL